MHCSKWRYNEPFPLAEGCHLKEILRGQYDEEILYQLSNKFVTIKPLSNEALRQHGYSHSMSNTLWNPLFKWVAKKFVSTLYKRYFILHPFLYEYAYKLGVSYKVCIKRLYNF